MPYRRKDGSCIDMEDSIHKTDIGFEDLSVWKERQRLPYRDGEHAYRRRGIPSPAFAFA